MHIPDGFLDGKTALAAGALAALGLTIALRRAAKYLPPNRVPLLGLAAAFVFAAQMINFPVVGGTSGHLIGAVLVAALLGPSAGLIVISAVLIVQCLMFADGGISALGANVFNMGVVAGIGGWTVYHLVSRAVKGTFGCVLAAAFAGWCSTVLAAIACAGELAVSGMISWSVVLPAMAGIHMLVGIGEGLITALVLSAIMRVRPELLHREEASEPAARSYGAVLAYGLLIALGLVLFVSPFASSWPDGLDRTAQMFGLKSGAPTLPAPMADYKVPGVHWSVLGTSIAGVLGTIVVFVLSWLVARTLVPQDSRSADAGSYTVP